jgi:hypothetical protein
MDPKVDENKAPPTAPVASSPQSAHSVAGPGLEIKASLHVLFGAGQVVEVRMPDTPRARCTTAGYYNDFERLPREVARFAGRGPGIYVTLNELNPALLARACNRLVEGAKQTTADNDILRRCWLPLDFDPKRPAGISSTDAEHEAALERARRCRAFLASVGWPEPVEGDSGNGAHLLYAIDLPNDPASAELVKLCLQSLAWLFDDALVQLDTSVYNAARIWKLYGTRAAKGDATADRPHRVSRLLSYPTDRIIVPRDLLEALAQRRPPEQPRQPWQAKESSRRAGDFDLARWITEHGLDIAFDGAWQGGHRWIFEVCPYNHEHTNRSAYIVRWPGGTIGAGCHHNSCQGKGWRELRQLYEPGCYDKKEQQTGQGGSASANGRPDAHTTPSQSEEPSQLVTTCLSTIRPRPLHFLVPDLIPLGKLGMIAGDGGHGKSSITLHMAACVTRGLPCFGLDYKAPQPGKVLLISCEDDLEDTVVPRLLAAGADLDRVLKVDGIKTRSGKPAPFSLAHFEALERELEANPDILLVVIDPAGAYIGRAGIDDHKDSELRALLGPLTEVAARRRVSILLVKHLVKGATAKAVHKVGGSAGYVNAVRAAYIVAPDPEDKGRKFFLPIKNNLTVKPQGLAYTLEGLPPDEAEQVLQPFSDLGDKDRRALGSQMFRVEWLGPVDVDADEVMAAHAKAERGPNKVDNAADWLKQFLDKFAYPSEEIFKACRATGFTKDNIYRAKAKLGKQTIRASNSKQLSPDGAWWWGLGDPQGWALRAEPWSPQHTLQGGQSAQTSQSPGTDGGCLGTSGSLAPLEAAADRPQSLAEVGECGPDVFATPFDDELKDSKETI